MILGMLTGAALLCAGFVIGMKFGHGGAKQQKPEPKELTEAERKIIEEAEERQRQWDNLLAYTGKSQMEARHENQ